MIKIDWAQHIGILRCPHTKEPVHLLRPEQIAKTNQQIASGKKMHFDGSKIAAQLSDLAVTNESQTHVYRIEGGIAWLLPILAIVDASGDASASQSIESEQVRQFYDEFGWVKNEKGNYNDSEVFTGTKSVSRLYVEECNKRISRQLGSGKYILDAASGPVPSKSYEVLSRNYSKRICVDFSQRALTEAKKNIGGHGLFILGTLTNLPLADGSVDDAISLHTIYHIPIEEQTTAINELVRAVKPGGKAIVVYTWRDAPLMTAALRATMFIGSARRGFRVETKSVAPQSGSVTRDLYFRPKGREWFSEIKRTHASARLRLWSSTSVRFHAAFFRNNILGKFVSRIVLYGELMFEPITARFGQYPMIVVRKE